MFFRKKSSAGEGLRQSFDRIFADKERAVLGYARKRRAVGKNNVGIFAKIWETVGFIVEQILRRVFNKARQLSRKAEPKIVVIVKRIERRLTAKIILVHTHAKVCKVVNASRRGYVVLSAPVIAGKPVFFAESALFLLRFG